MKKKNTPLVRRDRESTNRELERIHAELEQLKSRQLQDTKSLLPRVNQFYASLFEYMSETLTRDVSFDNNGDAIVTFTYKGIRPQGYDSVVKVLRHVIYIPMAPTERNVIDSDINFEIIEKPDGLRVEKKFERESNERATLIIKFPDGFEWSNNQKPFSYRVSYKLQDVFSLTIEEAKMRYGASNLHDRFYEWSSCEIIKPVKELNISVTFPEKYPPKDIKKWVWFKEPSFLRAEHNLSDNILLDKSEEIVVERNARVKARLKVKSPLFGFNYGIVWEPISTIDYQKVIKGSIIK